MLAIFDCGGRLLNLRVAAEVSPDEPTVPRPIVFAVAGRVDSDEPASCADIALKGALLLVAQQRPSGVEEQYDLVLREGRIGELGGVFGRIYAETVFGAQGPE